MRQNDEQRDGRKEGKTATILFLPLPGIHAQSTSCALRGRPHPLPWPPHLQPPSLSEWNPGRQRSHFQPVTVGLQTQAPEASHWRCREPGGGRAQGSGGAPPHRRRGRGQGAGPATCWVAVTGLARRPRAPAIEVLLAALAVWPGRVVPAAEAAPAVARAAEELPVEGALLRVATAVAGCGQEAGGGV